MRQAADKAHSSEICAVEFRLSLMLHDGRPSQPFSSRVRQTQPHKSLCNQKCVPRCRQSPLGCSVSFACARMHMCSASIRGDGTMFGTFDMLHSADLHVFSMGLAISGVRERHTHTHVDKHVLLVSNASLKAPRPPKPTIGCYARSFALSDLCGVRGPAVTAISRRGPSRACALSRSFVSSPSRPRKALLLAHDLRHSSDRLLVERAEGSESGGR